MRGNPCFWLGERILIYAIVLIFSVGIYSAYSQVMPVSITDSPPAKEVFHPSEGLMAPWRSGGCILSGKINGIPGCYLVTSKEFIASSLLSLYNDDGSLWYRFDVQPSNPGYFWTEKDFDLDPFSAGTSPSPDGPQYPNLVVLRVTAESPHWVQVIASEKTLSTKYVNKKDPLWKKTSWDHWLADGLNLYLPQRQEPLRDAPNGHAIGESADLRFTRVRFIKSDGDWAYVSGRELYNGALTSARFGWIKWRDGRRLLVVCYFSHNIPRSLTRR